MKFKSIFIQAFYTRKLLFFSLAMILPVQTLFSQDYFQQQVNNEIRVTLNDRKHELSGFESIEYINNSPDTLTFLYFHLWPNAYSGNNTCLAKELMARDGKSRLFNDPDLRGYIDSLNFMAEGRQLEWDLMDDSPDICKLILNSPLNPGDTLRITTPFHVKIPGGGISRMGHTRESYQISQWYPKPAVYDRTGWHQMPYLDQGEFFAEYGNFNVNITLPSNYVVGATGNLQNADETEWLNRRSADTAWMRIPYYFEEPFPPSSNSVKTLTYTQNNIHDFAWFADKRFRVLKGQIFLPESGRKVNTWVMFSSSEGYLWRRALKYVNNALMYFSEWIGDYPYDTFTAVQSTLSAGDGMEYPGLTVISSINDPYILDGVLAHEICHSWFYSAIGSDERRYPFMDESLTASSESRYLAARYPGKKLWELNIGNKRLASFLHAEKIPADRIGELDWLAPARLNREQKINLPATDFTPENYFSMIYTKASLGFTYLRSFLGDSLYDKAIHDYYSRWKNKHPDPDDLKSTFESNTGKDLSWFFDDFLGTTKKLDYKLVKYDEGKVLIKNKGKLRSPVLIAGVKGDSILSEKWIDGFEGSRWINTESAGASKIQIDPGHKMTELFRLNNNMRTNGIFPKTDPVQTQLLYAFEDPARRYLIWFPLLNWNRSDGLMLGVALQNGSVIPKPFQYFLVPFFTVSTPGVTGYGKISLNSTPYNSFIRLASFSLEGVQFGAPGDQNWRKAKMGVDMYLRSDRMTNNIDQKIYGFYTTASDLRQIESEMDADMLSYVQLGYQISRKGIVNPFSFGVSVETGDSYSKAAFEMNYKYSYRGKKSGLETRFFVGTMLSDNTADQLYTISASGRQGTEDYLYQSVFPDRFSKFHETFFSRQMTLSEGGLISAVNDTLGYSRWVFSLSLASGLPGKASIIPVKPFANLLLNDHGLGTGNPALYFEAGLKAGFWDIFEIYFPFIVSGNINDITGSTKDRIRFILRIDKLRSRLSE